MNRQIVDLFVALFGVGLLCAWNSRGIPDTALLAIVAEILPELLISAVFGIISCIFLLVCLKGSAVLRIVRFIFFFCACAISEITHVRDDPFFLMALCTQIAIISIGLVFKNAIEK